MVPRPPKMRYCTKCVYPASSAVPLSFDEFGVCSGCHVHTEKEKTDWAKREETFKKILFSYKSKGAQYDCVIGVSGGKDSYFQTYYISKVLGLKPLLVNYHGNNYLPEGQRNLNNMRKVFNADLLSLGPSIEVLKKLNKKCFIKMGDMNWHGHCGINTIPMKVACLFKIPIVIWGEHGYTDLGGMYSMNDLVEFTYKYRTEHACRGYDWDDMIDVEMGIKAEDLWCYQYPSDEDIEAVGVRGLYFGNYIYWDANAHAKKMVEECGFELSGKPFERTYRKFSNLDDMHENGAHDYMKYIKFGYGRCTDHVCKDIRGGYMTREQGIELVRIYDPVKSWDITDRWLEYVGMSEKEFDRIADTFRDKNVWWKDDRGHWCKDNIWDEDQLVFQKEMEEKMRKALPPLAPVKSMPEGLITHH